MLQPYHRAPLPSFSAPSCEHDTLYCGTATSSHHPLQYKSKKKTICPSPLFTSPSPSTGSTAKGTLFCSSVHFLKLCLPAPHPSHPQTPQTTYKNRCFHFRSMICLPHLGDFPANCITLFGQLAYKLIFLYK